MSQLKSVFSMLSSVMTVTTTTRELFSAAVSDNGYYMFTGATDSKVGQCLCSRLPAWLTGLVGLWD